MHISINEIYNNKYNKSLRNQWSKLNIRHQKFPDSLKYLFINALPS